MPKIDHFPGFDWLLSGDDWDRLGDRSYRVPAGLPPFDEWPFDLSPDEIVALRRETKQFPLLFYVERAGKDKLAHLLFASEERVHNETAKHAELSVATGFVIRQVPPDHFEISQFESLYPDSVPLWARGIPDTKCLKRALPILRQIASVPTQNRDRIRPLTVVVSQIERQQLALRLLRQIRDDLATDVFLEDEGLSPYHHHRDEYGEGLELANKVGALAGLSPEQVLRLIDRADRELLEDDRFTY